MRCEKRISLAITLLLSTGTGCTTGPVSRWSPHGPSLTVGGMAACLEEVSDLAPEAVPVEIARLEGGAVEGSAADRLKLAYLLSRSDTSVSDPDRAWEILKGLMPTLRDRDAQEIARLLARTITLERALRVERDRTAEAQQKIERLKGLERELDDSSRASQPLSPTPGESPPDGKLPARTPAATSHGGPSP